MFVCVFFGIFVVKGFACFCDVCVFYVFCVFVDFVRLCFFVSFCVFVWMFVVPCAVFVFLFFVIFL